MSNQNGEGRLAYANMTDEQIVERAQGYLDNAGVADGQALRLVFKHDTNIQQSKFEFEATDGSGMRKVVTLMGFLMNPRFKRKTSNTANNGIELKSKTRYEIRSFEEADSNTQSYEDRFYEVFDRNDLELVACSKNNGFLVRFISQGGHLKRYSNFNMVLGIELMFNHPTKGQYYVSKPFLDAGYEVELEYTIPNSQKRIDIVVWDQTHSNILTMIEFDGVQHNDAVTFFGDDDDALIDRKSSDKFKERFALALNKPFFRVVDPGGPFDKVDAQRAAFEIMSKLGLQ